MQVLYIKLELFFFFFFFFFFFSEKKIGLVGINQYVKNVKLFETVKDGAILRAHVCILDAEWDREF